MPKRIPEQELDAFLTVVATHPEACRSVPSARDCPTSEGQHKGRRYRVSLTTTGKVIIWLRVP